MHPLSTVRVKDLNRMSQPTLRFLRTALPSLSLALVILGIAYLNPRAMSYLD